MKKLIWLIFISAQLGAMNRSSLRAFDLLQKEMLRLEGLMEDIEVIRKLRPLATHYAQRNEMSYKYRIFTIRKLLCSPVMHQHFVDPKNIVTIPNVTVDTRNNDFAVDLLGSHEDKDSYKIKNDILKKLDDHFKGLDIQESAIKKEIDVLRKHIELLK